MNTISYCPWNTVSLKARLHRRFLSRQLDAIFVALKLQQVSNMLETPCDISATNRNENRTSFTRAILKLRLERNKNCLCKRAFTMYPSCSEGFPSGGFYGFSPSLKAQHCLIPGSEWESGGPHIWY